MLLAKRIKYPIWNAKTLTIVLTVVFTLSAGLTFFLGHKSVFVELQITLSVISLSLFAFLSIGLYKGIRIRKEKIEGPKFQPIDMFDMASGGLALPRFNDFDFLDSGDDLIGIVVSIVLWIIVSIVLVAILFFLASVAWAVLLALWFIVYWVFYRALRQAFLKSRVCRGNLIKSLSYGILYTAFYTGWMLGIIWASKYLLSG